MKLIKARTLCFTIIAVVTLTLSSTTHADEIATPQKMAYLALWNAIFGPPTCAEHCITTSLHGHVGSNPYHLGDTCVQESYTSYDAELDHTTITDAYTTNCTSWLTGVQVD